ncbi:TM2 domain-containing protein [Rhodoflexus sp.]
MEKQAAGNKKWITAVLLCFFLGGLGIHRFYLGYTWQGVVQLLTLGGLGIWALIDFIRILVRDLKPKDGEYAD